MGCGLESRSSSFSFSFTSPCEDVCTIKSDTNGVDIKE